MPIYNTPIEYVVLDISAWKPRLAIKMWSGWPTFPQVFINGTLVGGATDVESLVQSGKLQQILAEK